MQKFSLESNVYFGPGSAHALPEFLVELGFKRICVVIDENVANLPPSVELLRSLEASGLLLIRVHKARSSQEPTYTYLDEVANTLRTDEFDVLLGIGGGSTLDVAKGVGILRKNSGRGIDYRGMDKVTVPGVPVVLVPTTAGTGSEATRTASFIDPVTNTKLGINGRYVNCLFAVLDPVFVATCPKMPTIAAGLDALVHACEAVTCRTANAVSSLLGCEAVRLMFSGLPRTVRTPDDLKARADTLLGSHYAGLAMRNAGGGPASGISYPLGVHYFVPHGMAGGLLLPHVVAFNVAAGYWDGYAAIYDHLNVGGAHAVTTAEKADQFCARLFELYKAIGAPTTFSAYGVRREHIPHLAKLTLEQRRTNLELNPVDFGESDIVALLGKVLD